MDKYILQVMEDYIAKCSTTLKSIREQISPVICEITDNDDEYEQLMDTISHHYRDYWNAPTEHLVVETQWETDGSWHTIRNDDGTIDGVGLPSQASGTYKSRLQLCCVHNHPTGVSFQSTGDFLTMANNNFKYCITVAKDGVTITKNNNGLSYDYVEDTYMANEVAIAGLTHEARVIERLKRDGDRNGVNNLILRQEQGTITPEESKKLSDKITYDYYASSGTYDEEIRNINEDFKHYGVPYTVTHIPVDKLYERD